jgi:S-disulfanyl-L-cysteine oxidoreductase SoxD
MFRCIDMKSLLHKTARTRRAPLVAALALSLLAVGPVRAEKPWHDIGRDAKPAEIAAWDIDVRPDFKGLPVGAGSVDQGVEVWEAKCASCHGVFGESNEVFTPIVGGTTAKDIETGHVANLLPGKNYPQRSTMMKVATVSTLWDYINRAMPWNAPKSLSADEVYAVTAYILNLAEVVPSDYVLSDQNIADVQKRMPNRNGMTVYRPLWDVKGKGRAKRGVHDELCNRSHVGFFSPRLCARCPWQYLRAKPSGWPRTGSGNHGARTAHIDGCTGKGNRWRGGAAGA